VNSESKKECSFFGISRIRVFLLPGWHVHRDTRGCQAMSFGSREEARDRFAGYEDTQIDDDVIDCAALAVEDMLIWMRDNRISMLDAANGFVVREKDGSHGSVIRLGTKQGICIAVRAYLKALERGNSS
jgi:hypothetical protein